MNANGTQQLSATLRRRRGTAVILSMMFLILFSTLAVGFAVATEMSSQIAGNERNLSLARTSAESGMTFIRYQLGSITLPNGTNSSNLLQNTATQLASLPALSSAANMGSNTVQVTGSAIYIPSQTAYMSLDNSNSTKFQTVITQSGGNLIVTTHGVGPTATVTRGVQIQFLPASGNSAILNYGIAAHGPITVSGNATVSGATSAAQGSVLSATAGASPLTMSGNVSISGDFSDTNASGSLNMSGNITIGGYAPTSPNFAAHVHKGITTPAFPTVDTSMYAPYATNTYSSGSGSNVTVVNATIPPNTNPSFSGNTTIQGVLYIQTPNRVTFSGNVNITGAIVVANNPTGSNTMAFSGNVTASAINNLPANATFPAGERALTGSFLLAPSFAVTMSGNFGTIGGSLVADSFTFSGNAGGTVNGSVIALKDVPFTESGNSPFLIGSSTTGIPTGLVFPGGFGASQGTYVEVP